MFKMRNLTFTSGSKTTRRNLRNGIIFVSPWIIGFLAFSLAPFAMSLYYSFTIYSAIKPPVWAGLQNFEQLFQDPLFWKSLYNTVYYAVFQIPLSIVLGIILALLLNANLKGISLYRTLFYLPTIVPLVGASILWLWLFDPQFGVINAILAKIGIVGPGWLVSTTWSKPALIIMALWGVGGSMILYLASLKDVPKEMYESAEIDGAMWWHKIRYITLPMISPVIFYTIVIGVIYSLQYFTQAYVITSGGPNDSTLFYSLYLYNNAFRYFHMGYASAMAWILFVIILVATLLIFRSSARWVFYGGERTISDPAPLHDASF